MIINRRIAAISRGFCTPAIVLIAAADSTVRRSNEETLLNYLFDDYNPSARPVFNSSLTVAVNIRFSLLQIQELVGL